METEAYIYFLSLNQLQAEPLQEMLSRVLLFLVEASGEPVLLSMLVLIFSDGDESMSRLPSSRLQLYETALSEAIKRRLYSAATRGDDGEEQADAAAVEVAEVKEVAEAKAPKKGESKEDDDAAKAEARKAARKAGTSSFMGNKTTKFSTETKSVDLVFAEYGHVTAAGAEPSS